MAINFDAIPEDLRQDKRLCCWRAIPDEENPAKINKIPWQPDGIRRLAWSNPANLLSFDEAKDLYLAGQSLPAHKGQHYAGIGYIINGSGDLVCIDLDHSINEAGEISPGAKVILERLKSYTEKTPSGRGLHIWIKASIDGPNIPQIELDGQAVEIFVRSHHVTLTGDVLPGYEALESRQVEAEALYYRLQAFQAKTKDKPKEAPRKADGNDYQKRAAKYVEKALEYEAQAVRDESEGNRNNRLNEAAFSIGRYVGAGHAFEGEVERALLRAARAAGLAEDEARATIRSGLRAGMDNLKDPELESLPDNPKQYPDDQHKEDGPDISEEIHLKALEILEHGDPIQFISDSCGRMVLGAEKAFKKLICCVAVQGIKQSSGLHPKLNGESGSGKTWVVLTFAHHLPPEAVVKGSSSNLAAFYHQDGDQVFRILDDYQAGNETLDTIIKQTSSVFHQKYDHRTVKKQEPVTLYIGSEQTWAITSVDSSQDIQVLNRQIPINVDDSEVLTRKVNARTIQRYGEGEGQFPEDETVRVCREIWRILRADGLISVKIPFWQRIEWLEVSNRRNPSLFMDLLVAHTAMNRYQREKDSEGYYLATEDDFQAAKALFTDKDAEELVHRLTRKEREFTDLLSKHPGGLTREEAAEALQISVNRVSQLAYGEKGKGGLTQKLPGFTAEDITDSEMLDAGECKRRSTKRTLFKLSIYDALTGFDAVVVLKDENSNVEDRKDRKDGVRPSVRIDECKENSNGERENREREIECKECKDNVREALGKDKSEIFPLSLKNPEKSLHQEESASIEAKDILTPSLPNPYGPYAKALDDDEESLHPKCAVCGADLAGKGQIEKGGKLYCARPGCGYPERGEASST
jgi:primase-polymerase (primpol)-like protein